MKLLSCSFPLQLIVVKEKALATFVATQQVPLPDTPCPSSLLSSVSAATPRAVKQSLCNGTCSHAFASATVSLAFTAAAAAVCEVLSLSAGLRKRSKMSAVKRNFAGKSEVLGPQSQSGRQDQKVCGSRMR